MKTNKIETFLLILRITFIEPINKNMTTIRKNQYEELIDAMMIEEVAGVDQEIADTLRGLDVDKKRMAILSILDKDRDMFLKIKGIVGDNDVSKTEHIKEVVKMLRKYVTVGDFEKKSVGEVQTPWSLVSDICSKLNENVWSNPNLKWLDNSTGTGIFVAYIVEKLMEGLKDFESDDELRYKHIMENMIYVSELQSKNCFLYLCSYDPQDEYELNIYNGSFLDEGFNNHMREVYGVEKFDIIVMNPPYQYNKEGQKKTHPIWDKFVNKSFDILVEGGYMCAVHPSGWRNIDGRFKTTQKLLRSKQVKYLEIHNADDGVKTFGAATRYDFYCVKNVDSDNYITTIKCEDGSAESVDISEMEFIPNGKFAEIKNLIAKDGEEKVVVLNSRSAYGSDKSHMNKRKDEEHTYPCIQNVNVKNELSCIHHSNTIENGHFWIPKVIFGRKSSGVFVDEDGSYGLAQDCSGIVDDVENLSLIKTVLQNGEFLKLSKLCDVGGSRDWYNRKVIATFRKDFWKEFLN